MCHPHCSAHRFSCCICICILTRCVIPTVLLAVLLAGAAGAGLFFLLYYILFLMSQSLIVIISTITVQHNYFSLYYILFLMSEFCIIIVNVSFDNLFTTINLLFTQAYCPWTQMPTGCYQFFQDSQVKFQRN